MNDTNLRVREADATDAARLSLVGRATLLQTYAESIEGDDIVAYAAEGHSRANYEALLRAPQSQAWLAEVTATRAPVGYALLTQPDLPGARAGDLEVRRLYVLPAYHGRRVGAELLGRAIDAARSAGAPRVMLSVYSANPRARAFYERFGFGAIGDRDFWMNGRAYADHVLALPLSRA